MLLRRSHFRNDGKSLVPSARPPLTFTTLVALITLLSISNNTWTSLDTEISSQSSLTIQTTTSKNFTGPDTVSFSTYDWASDYVFTLQMDEIVLANFSPSIGSGRLDGSLLSYAILARGYLCLLFSAMPVLEYESLFHDDNLIESICGTHNLAHRLLSFILARVHSLISEIIPEVGDLSDDDNRNLDAAAAAGILYCGLTYVTEGIMRGGLRPLCVC
jgi:hypothetical protein